MSEMFPLCQDIKKHPLGIEEKQYLHFSSNSLIVLTVFPLVSFPLAALTGIGGDMQKAYSSISGSISVQ